MEQTSQDARLVERAHWLIKLRWLGIICAGTGTYFSSAVLAIELHESALYGIVVLLAVYNLTVLLVLNRMTRANRKVSISVVKRIINFQMYADLVLLTVILHFSGGIENPFVLFFIFHMIIASILLSVRESYLQATFGVLLFGLLLLFEYSELIPHHCLKGFIQHCLHREGVYTLGTFFVFAMSLYLVVYMTSHIAVRLRRAEQALRSSHDYLGRILNGMHEGLIVVDRNFEIKDVNRRFLEQCGVIRDEVIGSRCYQISHHVDKPCSESDQLCPAMKVFDTGETVRVEHTHIDSDSNPYHVELNAFPLFAPDGNVEAVVELSHDITERRRAEQTLRDTNLLLKEKDRIKDEYVRRVTHDIKGHLTTIQYCLSPIVDGETGEFHGAKMDFARRAHARAGKLRDFVRKLLRLTQMRLSNRLEMKAFSMGDALRTAVSTVKAKAEDKSIALDCNITSSLGKIIGNQFSFEEMVTNLLLNAIKYTPENGTVEVSAEDRQDCVVVQIADTGIGIPTEEQGKIFDEFYRAANAQSVERDGTGLGLSIVKYIVERHGGEIRVESKEGRGATFRIRLPKDQSSDY